MRVSRVLGGKAPVHNKPQLIPDRSDVTDPEPLPERATVITVPGMISTDRPLVCPSNGVASSNWVLTDSATKSGKTVPYVDGGQVISTEYRVEYSRDGVGMVKAQVAPSETKSLAAIPRTGSENMISYARKRELVCEGGEFQVTSTVEKMPVGWMDASESEVEFARSPTGTATAMTARRRAANVTP